jgi:hypothetical protein
MKGVSLLVALATLGVDIGWDAGPSGNLLYTIRIERVLLEPMRTGQPVVSGVDAKDRGLRRFQIIMDDAASQPAANELRVADDSELQYGWRPAEEGEGLEYLIQITPERLETLAKGVPIVGEVLPEVPEIHRFHISVGVGQLPRVGLTQPVNNNNQPPSFLSVRDANSRNPSPRNTESRFQIPNRDDSGSFDDSRFPSQTNGSANRGSSRDYAEQGRWSSDNSGQTTARGDYPPRNNGATQLTSNEERWRSQTQDPYHHNNTLQGNYPDNRLADTRYTQRPSAPQLTDPRGTVQQPPTSYAPAAANAPLAQNTPQPPAQPQTNWQQTPAAQPPPNATNWQPPSSEKATQEAEEPTPWMPLILTTFALFASLGANAYIAWLAWSFFWRFRQAADDLERARSLAAASRQAA